MKKLNVAIIGQGRSGRDIHGKFLLSEDNTFFNVKYVVEADEERRKIAAETYEGCTVFEDYRSLFEVDDVDLVVNASYSYMHYPVTKDLLEHGKNVMVEKPFARNRYECDDLINTAKKHGVILTVFQQTMVAPFYLKIKELIEKGLIGEPKIVNIHYSGFARRWDWQTLQKKLGGGLYNTGPHPLGLGLDFLGFSKETKVVYSMLDRGLTSGDSDDIAKVVLTAPGKPVVDIEVNSTDPYSDFNVKVIGTRGAIKSTTTKYNCKYIIPGENPEKPVQEEFIYGENRKPVYCSENLITHEENGEVQGTAFTTAVHTVYENLYYAITEGREILLKPENFALLIGIIEEVHASNPLDLKY